MNNINLLPQDLRERTSPDPWYVGSVIVGIAALVLIGVLSSGASNERNSLETKLKQLNAEAALYTPDINEQSTLSAELQELDKDIRVVEIIKGRYREWSYYLSYFLNAIPTSRGGRLEVSMGPIRISAAEARDRDRLGKEVDVVFSFAATAISEEAWKAFVGRFENSPEFAIYSRQTAPDDRTGYFNFDATVGLARPKDGGQ